MVIIMNKITKFKLYANKLKYILKRIIYTKVDTIKEYIADMITFKVKSCIYCHKCNINSKGYYPTEN